MSEYKNINRKEAESFDLLVEYYCISKTITKDTNILKSHILNRDFKSSVDFVAELDGKTFIIEIKGRHNTSTKYPDNILEFKKTSSIFEIVAQKLNYERVEDNLYDYYSNLSKLAQKNNIIIYYYNYFVTDDKLFIWDLADVFINDKFDISGVDATHSSTKGYSGFNETEYKKTYRLKNGDSIKHYDNFIKRPITKAIIEKFGTFI